MGLARGQMGSGMAYCRECFTWYAAVSRPPHVCTADPNRPMNAEDDAMRVATRKLMAQIALGKSGQGGW